MVEADARAAEERPTGPREGRTRAEEARERAEDSREALALAREILTETSIDDVISRTLDNLSKVLGESHPRAVLARTILPQLQPDTPLFREFMALEAPSADNPLTEIIRSVVGSAGPTVTRSDVQVATLAALLTPLRQSDVGSCFGTCIAIRTQLVEPARFVRDVRDISRKGTITRRVDGRDVEFRVSRAQSRQRLTSEIPPTFTADEVLGVEGVAAALFALGIPSNDYPSQIQRALSALRGKALVVTLEQVLEQIAAEQVKLTATDANGAPLRGRAALLRSNEIDGEIQSLRASLRTRDLKDAERSALNDQVIALNKSRANLDEFRRRLDLAISRFVELNDNRLLRAWEYTITSMAEQVELGSLAADRREALVDAVIKVLFPRFTADLSDLNQRASILNRFRELVNERLRYVLDPEFAFAGTSLDGRSTRGVWRLVDRTRVADADEGLLISGPDEFLILVRGLLLEAGADLDGANGILNRTLAERLISEIDVKFLRSFLRSLNPSASIPTLNPDVLETLLELPWRADLGGSTRRAAEIYYEYNPDPSTFDVGADQDVTHLAEFLIDQARALGARGEGDEGVVDERFAVPMRLPGHGFLFRPGLEPFAQALKGSGESRDLLNELLPPLNRVSVSRAAAEDTIERVLAQVSGALFDQDSVGQIRVDLVSQLPQGRLRPSELERYLRMRIDAGTSNQNPDVKAIYVVLNSKVRGIDSRARPAIRKEDLATVVQDALKELGFAVGSVVGKSALSTLSNTNQQQFEPHEIEDAIAKNLRFATSPSPRQIAAAVLDVSPRPRAVPFADANWGGGPAHTFFAFEREPLTDKIRLRQLDQPGTASEEADVRIAGRWEVFKTPPALADA